MSKLFGCLTNESPLVGHALYPYRHLLEVSEADSPYGWGIAYYDQQEVLAKRRPRHIGPLSFYKRVRDIRGNAIVGHVRKLRVGRTIPENTQPYRFRMWTCAHRGYIARFDQIRPWILNSIPNFLRRNIKGETDSEHLFHLFLAFLYDEGMLDAHDLPAEAVAKAMRNTFRTAERFVNDAGGGDSQVNMLVTNGRIMLVSADSGPVYHARIDGLRDCELCRLPPESWNAEPVRRDHDNLKFALLIFDPPEGTGTDGLTRTDPRTLVAADESFNVFTLPMDG